MSAFSVPFAFALGALIMRYPGEKWIHITRRWTMVTWLFLTCGIFLGAHWAYAVLGWGGYWGWDPVENASLHALAHRHRVSAFGHDAGKARHDEGLERVADLHHLHAVHPRHAADAQRHGQFRPRVRAVQHRQLVLRISGRSSLWSACVFLLPEPRPSALENKLESLVSRESSFLFNNLLLLARVLHRAVRNAVPHLSELVRDVKMNLGAPFYNKVMVPIGLA